MIEFNQDERLKFFKFDSISGEREELDVDRILVITKDGQQFYISAPSSSDGRGGLCILGGLFPIRVYPFAANKIIVEEEHRRDKKGE